MPGEITKKITAWTHPQGDNTCLTTVGSEYGTKLGNNGNVSLYAGAGVVNNKGNIGVGAVVDLKGSYKYGSLFDGRVSFGASGRIRNNINTNSQSVQFRAQPFNVDFSINEGVGLGISPYGALKYDYAKKELSPSLGAFATFTQQITPNLALKEEAQLYDLTDVGNKENFGVNIGIVWTF